MEIIIGILSGIAASMGLGGGFVLLLYLSVFTDTPQITAQGVNLLFFLPIALFSVVIHAKNKLIDLKTVLKYAVGGILGALAGSAAAFFIDAAVLKKLFAILLFFAGVRELAHRPEKQSKTEKT